jgi:hypothetical protein
MGIDVVGNRNGWWRVGQYWWHMLADYSHHIAPTITASCRYWYTSDEDGLNADQACQLGAALQRSVDDCRIDAYTRQLFARLCNEKSVPSFVRFDDELFDCRELPRRDQERRFVDEFVSEVQRFIEFLRSCEGFRIQ